MNKPLVKKEWEGSKTGPYPYLHQYPNRRARRAKPNRQFNNKKGIQLVVTNFGRGQFSKVKKELVHLEGKTIVQYKVK